jgi:hypothetical protein
MAFPEIREEPFFRIFADSRGNHFATRSQNQNQPRMNANRPSGARMSHGNPSDHAIHGRQRRQPLETALAAAREDIRTSCGGGPLARRNLELNPFASIR